MASPTINASKASLPSSPTTVTIPEPFGELDGELTRIASSTKIDLRNLSLKQVYQERWSKMQSWGSFIDTNRMKIPSTTLQWTKRLIRNIEHFGSNYLCVFLILVCYCVLTSPLLLLAIAASLGACYIIALKNAESPLKLFGYKLSLGQQYIMIGILSFPLFYLAGAGSAVFWVIGASFFVIGLHASIYAIESSDQDVLTSQPFDPPFSGVQTV